ncbi:MAG: multiple monosaccharide ABC transporter permease [Clostridiaceae bacterium]
MGKLKGSFKNNIRQYAMLIVLVFIILLFEGLTGGILLKPQNVTNLILQNSYVIILATGMVLCILTGGNIDLSVGSIVALIGALIGTLLVVVKLSLLWTLIIALGAGLLIGMWQGFWIAYIRIPAFIVTLAGMLLFRGMTLIILQGKTIAPLPSSSLAISSGFIPDFLNVFGAKINVTTIIVGLIISVIYLLIELKNRRSKRKYSFENISIPFFILKVAAILFVINIFSYSLASYKGIPIVLVLLAALVLIYSFITTNTVPGRYIYAMGGNEKAAKLSGINTNKVLFWVYVNMAVLAALTGFVFTARLQAATPTAGVNFELDAIASCFIGGASAIGGYGTVVGTIIGAFVMGFLNNGMSIMGVGSDWQQAIKGFVLLMAVAFDVISKSKSK